MTADLQKIYATWIEQICTQKGINRTQIAKRIGVSPSTITRQTKAGWTNSPQLKIVQQIAVEFGIDPPQTLVGGGVNAAVDNPVSDIDEVKQQIRSLRDRTTESQFSVAAINRRIDLIEIRLDEIIDSLRKASKK